MDPFYDAWQDYFGPDFTEVPAYVGNQPNTAFLFETVRNANNGYGFSNAAIQEQYDAYIADGAEPGRMVTVNRALGIQDSGTRGSMRASGFQGSTQGSQQGQGDCGCHGQTNEFACANGMRTTQLYPATRVPKIFTATHQRVKGWHNVYIGSTMIAQFSRKASANVFCRSWNDMMKHLGSAVSFDIPTLTFMFNSVIDGGSGAWGLKNGFDPPFHGSGGTVPPDA